MQLYYKNFTKFQIYKTDNLIFSKLKFISSAVKHWPLGQSYRASPPLGIKSTLSGICVFDISISQYTILTSILAEGYSISSGQALKPGEVQNWFTTGKFPTLEVNSENQAIPLGSLDETATSPVAQFSELLLSDNFAIHGAPDVTIPLPTTYQPASL